MHNLELKVRCPDDATLAVLETHARERGATYLRTMRQRDTYFVAPHGRLKLREWSREDINPQIDDPGGDGEAGERGATLIAYDRPDSAGTRLSDYLLCPVPDPSMLRESLARALGTWLVVEKRRRLCRWGHTRIHFDRVLDLGPFVELETVVEHFSGPETARQEAAEIEHRRVIAALGLERLLAIAGSYSDLLAHAR
jgi:adenylate cyclase class 2